MGMEGFSFKKSELNNEESTNSIFKEIDNLVDERKGYLKKRVDRQISDLELDRLNKEIDEKLSIKRIQFVKLLSEKQFNNKNGLKEDEINSSVLFDLYINAYDMSRRENAITESDLITIKSTAKHIRQQLFELGVTKLPTDSVLGQVYISACKISKKCNDVEKARQAMEIIATLIIKSEGFQESGEKWNEENKKIN